jgi:mono/diheme cytochrome c family protein
LQKNQRLTFKNNKMKKYTFLAIITAGAAFLFMACGGGNTETSQVPKEETQVKDEAKPEASGLAAQLQTGEKIYKEKCIVCHMADAKGVAGAFPPLAGSDYLLADPKRGIAQTLNGSHEVMVINGVSYNALMTPQVQTKEDAVAVVNYVLKTFNNYTDDKLLTIEDAAGIEIKPIEIK